jgi:hypothetical protein
LRVGEDVPVDVAVAVPFDGTTRCHHSAFVFGGLRVVSVAGIGKGDEVSDAVLAVLDVHQGGEDQPAVAGPLA